ncbi:MAG: AsnC family transcriptional regulator [Candidatus Aenigmarchaeota archaeon]|nr:AsnC family transcriptional regulator [Candidatus Aenigmarchaeota archaeon]
MIYNIDQKDKQLLAVLLENSRTPLGIMAKEVGLSKNAILYRIRKLKERGIIWKFFAPVEYKKLDIYQYHVFIKLRASAEREKEIKEYFKNHPNVVWAGSIFGRWDLFVQFLVKKPAEFENILDDVLTFLGDSLESYDSKTLMENIKLDHQIFTRKKSYKKIHKEIPTENIYILDDIDKKILHHLNTVDGLANYQELGKASGSSMETARNHFRRLVHDGIIRTFFPFVVHKKLGLIQYFVQMNFRYMTKKIEAEIVNYIKSTHDIHLAFKVIGRPEIYFWYATDKQENAEALVRDIKNKFFRVLTDIEPMITTEEFTLNFFPKGLL